MYPLHQIVIKYRFRHSKNFPSPVGRPRETQAHRRQEQAGFGVLLGRAEEARRRETRERNGQGHRKRDSLGQGRGFVAAETCC